MGLSKELIQRRGEYRHALQGLTMAIYVITEFCLEQNSEKIPSEIKTLLVKIKLKAQKSYSHIRKINHTDLESSPNGRQQLVHDLKDMVAAIQPLTKDLQQVYQLLWNTSQEKVYDLPSDRYNLWFTRLNEIRASIQQDLIVLSNA